MDKIRKTGDFTITQSMQIGEIEVVLGENMEAKDGKYYIVANYEFNEVFELSLIHI